MLHRTAGLFLISVNTVIFFIRAILTIYLKTPNIAPGTAALQSGVLYAAFAAILIFKTVRRPDGFYSLKYLVLLIVTLVLSASAGVLFAFETSVPGQLFPAGTAETAVFICLTISLLVMNVLFYLFILGESNETTMEFEAGLLLYQGEAMYAGLLAGVNSFILTQSESFLENLNARGTGLEEFQKTDRLSGELFRRVTGIQKLIQSRNLLLDKPVTKGEVIDLFSFISHTNELLKIYESTNQVNVSPIFSNITLRLPYKYLFTIILLTAVYLQKYHSKEQESVEIGLDMRTSNENRQELILKETTGQIDIPDWERVVEGIHRGVADRTGRNEFIYWLNFYVVHHLNGEIMYFKLDKGSQLVCSYDSPGIVP